MNQSDLAAKLSEVNPSISGKDSKLAIDLIFAEFADALAKGDRLEIRGFGTFFAGSRNARLGRNPKTGEPVQVEAKRVARFKPSKQLLERIAISTDLKDQ